MRGTDTRIQAAKSSRGSLTQRGLEKEVNPKGLSHGNTSEKRKIGNHNTIVPALLGIEPNIIKLPNDSSLRF